MQIKILIVEDSSSDRLIIQKRLSQYETLTACDGMEAMKIIEKNNDISLIILDLKMPVMDGFQVLEKINADERLKKIRTIILTNYDEPDNEIKGLKLGAADYIRKPIQMDSLKARIEVHIELIRAEKALENKLHEQAITFDTIFQKVPVGISIAHNKDKVFSETNRFFSVNPAFERITGRTKEELVEMGWQSITHPEDLQKELENARKLDAGEIEGYSMEKRYIRPDGSTVWVNVIVAPLVLSNDHKYNHIAIVQDITKRKSIEDALTESERSKSVLLSHLPGMAYRCNNDRKWTMKFVSEGCYELTGYRAESLIDNKELSFYDLIAAEYRELLWQQWETILSEKKTFNYEYEIVKASGERRWVLEMGQGVYDEQGDVEALEGIIIDITDHKVMENTLKYNNDHDRWTGLHNRTYLEKMIDEDTKKEFAGKRALISINLFTLKSLTKIYGFHYTQDLVKEIAKALKVHCDNEKRLFYTYADRFVLYVKNYNEKEYLELLCEKIALTLDSILSIERVGGGIGVLEISKDFEGNADVILKNLLLASEKATEIKDKDFGICFYDSKMQKQILREQEIKWELSRLASFGNKGNLYLQYQPIVDTESKAICGFEALARFKNENLGQVPPLEFIPVAEKTKLIIPIGELVIRQAFSFLKRLNEEGYEDINVSVNISVIQILKEDFCSNFFRLMDEMKVRPENVGIEITESVFTSSYIEINKILGEMKKAGIHIYIDDFGTGYSSLARERELNINSLKIDKFFVDDLMVLDPQREIIIDIISMAHKFDHKAIAEGVEHEKQRKNLIKCGCDRIQGFLISKPLDEDDAIKFLRKNTKRKKDSTKKGEQM